MAKKELSMMCAINSVLLPDIDLITTTGWMAGVYIIHKLRADIRFA